MTNSNLFQSLSGGRKVQTMQPDTSGRNLSMFPNKKAMKLFTNQQSIEHRTKPLTRANSHGYQPAKKVKYIEGWLEFKKKIWVSHYSIIKGE